MKTYKAKKVYSRYMTRKDFYHTSYGAFMSYYRKKYYRKVANAKLRKYKSELSNGSMYRKIAEVQWQVV